MKSWGGEVLEAWAGWAAEACPAGARLATAAAWQLPHRRISAAWTSSMAQCHLTSESLACSPSAKAFFHQSPITKMSSSIAMLSPDFCRKAHKEFLFMSFAAFKQLHQTVKHSADRSAAKKVCCPLHIQACKMLVQFCQSLRMQDAASNTSLTGPVNLGTYRCTVTTSFAVAFFEMPDLSRSLVSGGRE